ncbi:response regulator [Veronia pacifica]|uniref:Response regulatory domain-containing protein n=1 Tax=Veronia pacifica TaxID=1080227 RepID=A0A1C3EIP7_9GAMM|nr:response regulator [Veronia pacifica]ODA33103.1 hypothetical protein A8L45_11745 [Veronia pacifica]
MRNWVKNDPVIVLADSELSHISFHQQVLSNSGFWLRPATTKEELEPILNQLPVDILILGSDFLLEEDKDLMRDILLLRRYETCRNARIIVTANDFSHEDKQEAYAAGAFDYMVYPILPEEMYAKVNAFARSGSSGGTSAISRSFHTLSELSEETPPAIMETQSFVHKLIQSSLTPNQHNYIQAIEQNLNRLQISLNNMRDSVQINNDQLYLSNSPFDLDLLLDNVCKRLTQEAVDHQVELLFQIPIEVPRSLVGDPERLSRTLYNLLIEAIKCSREKTVFLSVHAESINERSVSLNFSMMENCLNDEEGTLFEVVNRVGSALTDPSESLNMFITSYMVQTMGGELSCIEEDSCKGMSLNLTLQRSVSIDSNECAVSVDMSGLQVLLINDNEGSRVAHQQLLEDMSFHCVGMDSNDDVLAFLDLDGNDSAKTSNIDLIFLDAHLQGENSELLIERLESLDDPNNFPPIIVTQNRKVNCPFNFADAQLIKPLSASSIFDCALSVMANHLPAQHPRIKAALSTDSMEINGAGLRILLVDDMPINQRIIHQILSEYAFEIDFAGNGEEAVTAVQNSPDRYDAVLMDLEMPVMNGYEASRIIRTMVDAKTLPILAVTANNNDADKERCFEWGMNGHVGKPIDVNTLLGTLSDHLDLTEDKSAARRNLEGNKTEPAKDLFVDMRKGVHRLMGNQSLFVKLLGDFFQSGVETQDMINDAINEGRLDDAATHCHTLVGLAGNLSMQPLMRSSKSLRQRLMTGKDFVTQLDRMQDTFEKTLAEVSSIMLANSEGSGLDSDTAALKSIADQQTDSAIPSKEETEDKFMEKLRVLNERIVAKREAAENDRFYVDMLGFEDDLSLTPSGKNVQKVERSNQQKKRQPRKPTNKRSK